MIFQAYREVFKNSNASVCPLEPERLVTSCPLHFVELRWLLTMRRTQAILVIMALLATPLALLARGLSGGNSECTTMCCLAHGHRAAQHKEMECQHGGMGHVFECAMTSGHHMDYGLIAPIVPAVPSAVTSIASPDVQRRIFSQFHEVSATGPLSVPFQPPRI
jgi:hypothetical protein